MNPFRRPHTHYGKTPEPETPYQRAAQVWDERIGSARVQARNWRLMAFGCLILAGGFASALILLAWRRRVPAAVAAALAGTFAFFHGAAHGVELAGGNAASLLAGMVLATALLHGAGLLLGHRLLARSQVLAVGAGAGVALFGAALLLRLA